MSTHQKPKTGWRAVGMPVKKLAHHYKPGKPPMFDDENTVIRQKAAPSSSWWLEKPDRETFQAAARARFR